MDAEYERREAQKKEKKDKKFKEKLAGEFSISCTVTVSAVLVVNAFENRFKTANDDQFMGTKTATGSTQAYVWLAS